MDFKGPNGHFYLIPVPTKTEKILTRFLARFLTRIFDQGFLDRKYSVQYYWDVETQDQDRNQDQDQT